MTIIADPKQLDIRSAKGSYKVVVFGAGLGDIFRQPIRDMGFFRGDVDVVKEIVLHEETVALLVGGSQTVILVQVDRGHMREIHLFVFVEADNILVRANWGGAGCKPEHTERFKLHLRRDDARGFAAHIRIIYT